MFERATKAEIAWVAGIFEGEGSVHVTGQSRTRLLHPRIQIVSTDLDVLTRVQKIVGTGVIYQSKRAKLHHKIAYRYVINKAGEVDEFCSKVWEWLGDRRKRQASLVWEQYVIGRSMTCEICGDEFWVGSNSKTCSDECAAKRKKVLDRARDRRVKAAS